MSSITNKPAPSALHETTNTKRVAPENSRSSSSKRIVLTPSKSATNIREKGHDCTTIEDDYTATKVNKRLQDSAVLLAFAYAFDCETGRGPTRYNGNSCSCGGCQAGHAALTPTLYDNILDIISEKLTQFKLSDLDPHLQSYMQTRFAPTLEECEKLSSDDVDVRNAAFKQIISRLTEEEKKGTFVNTLTEKARNATYDNPTSSNRFDSHLERSLRPKEDELAAEKGEPIQALLRLQAEYRRLVEVAIPNLEAHYVKLDNLHKAWDTMIGIQIKLQGLDVKSDEYKAEFLNYFSAIGAFLQAREIFFQKSEGAPSFNAFKERLSNTQSPYALKELLKLVKEGEIDEAHDYFSKKQKILQIDPAIDNDFIESRAEIGRTIHEAKLHLKVLDQKPEEINFMLKHHFGDLNPETKTLITPTKEKMQQSFLRLMPTLTPERKDLKKNKAGQPKVLFF